MTETLYRRLLVPLDGSVIAESALPEAVALAKLTGAEIMLFEAVPPLDQLLERDAHPIFIDEQWEARRGRALRYLREIASRKDFHGVRVQVAVEMGPVADTILEYARRNDADAIVMATHGFSGFRRWLLGGVSQRVLQGADRTVILVRPQIGR